MSRDRSHEESAPSPRPSRASSKADRKRRSSSSASGPAALTRVLRIHQALAKGNRLDAVRLAEELSLSPRTIKRDIERLRDFHGAPIEWDRARRTYVYTRPCPELPLLNLTADEALALALAGDTFVAWRGTPLGRALSSAFAKIGGGLGEAVSLPAKELTALITPAAEGPDAETENRAFPVALQAILRRQPLRFAYWKPHGPTTTRTVHPLHLAFLEHRWVLIAWDPKAGRAKRFILARMSSLEPRLDSFEPPSGFDLHAHLAGSFGLHAGDALQTVRLRFDAYAAPYIQERRWHSSQVLTRHPDGSLEVELRVGHLLDVRRWVLSWGRHAQVLEPPQLRTEIAGELVELNDTYAREVVAIQENAKKSGAGHPVSP